VLMSEILGSSQMPKNVTDCYSQWVVLKVKVKFHPRTDHVNPKGDYMYNCTLSLTSALDRGGR
jgi:hypothetical protein